MWKKGIWLILKLGTILDYIGAPSVKTCSFKSEKKAEGKAREFQTREFNTRLLL